MTDPARRASIRDVASAAGVSLTTVSHVLNEVEGARVAPDTRERVRAAARRLDYVPSRMARGLRRQRTDTLGFISDRIATTPHAGKIVLGAQERALASDRTLLLFDSGADPELEARHIRALLHHQVDGVLYARMYHQCVSVPAELGGVPLVLLDARTDDEAFPAVVPDEVEGARTAVAELLGHGHTRIGFVTNVDDIPATHGRLEGYRAALGNAEIAFDAALVIPEESEASGGYRAARRLLEGRQPPTGLFCFNDRMAMGAYRAAVELGLRIPTDVSVVGFDNHEYIAEGLYPGLTTIALPHYEMGAWAVDRLLGLLDDPGDIAPAPPKLMPCPLVRRDSVAPPRQP